MNAQHASCLTDPADLTRLESYRKDPIHTEEYSPGWFKTRRSGKPASLRSEKFDSARQQQAMIRLVRIICDELIDTSPITEEERSGRISFKLRTEKSRLSAYNIGLSQLPFARQLVANAHDFRDAYGLPIHQSSKFESSLSELIPLDDEGWWKKWEQFRAAGVLAAKGQMKEALETFDIAHEMTPDVMIGFLLFGATHPNELMIDSWWQGNTALRDKLLQHPQVHSIFEQMLSVQASHSLSACPPPELLRNIERGMVTYRDAALGGIWLVDEIQHMASKSHHDDPRHLPSAAMAKLRDALKPPILFDPNCPLERGHGSGIPSIKGGLPHINRDGKNLFNWLCHISNGSKGELIEALLSSGFRPDVPPNARCWLTAVQTLPITTLEKLKDKTGINIHEEDKAVGGNCVFEALRREKQDEIPNILHRLAEWGVDLWSSKRHIDKRQSDFGQDPHHRFDAYFYGQKVPRFATRSGLQALLDIPLEPGFNPSRFPNARFVLFEARHGNLSHLEKLKERGYKLDERDPKTDEDALYVASPKDNGYVDKLRFLMQQGLDPLRSHSRTEGREWTLLDKLKQNDRRFGSTTTSEQSKAALTLIVERFADPDVDLKSPDIAKQYPFLTCLEFGSLDLCKKITAKGSDFSEIRDHKDPLYIAFDTGDSEKFDWLIDTGKLDPYAARQHKTWDLMDYAKKNRVGTTHLLMKHGIGKIIRTQEPNSGATYQFINTEGKPVGKPESYPPSASYLSDVNGFLDSEEKTAHVFLSRNPSQLDESHHPTVEQLKAWYGANQLINIASAPAWQGHIEVLTQLRDQLPPPMQQEIDQGMGRMATAGLMHAEHGQLQFAQWQGKVDGNKDIKKR